MEALVVSPKVVKTLGISSKVLAQENVQKFKMIPFQNYI